MKLIHLLIRIKYLDFSLCVYIYDALLIFQFLFKP